MRIEEITSEILIKAGDEELKVLKQRFLQLWEKYFKSKPQNEIGSLNKISFISKYEILKKEMVRRDLFNMNDISSLDNHILVKSTFRFDASEFADITITPNYCSITGSYIKNPREANEVDIIMKRDEDTRDKELEQKIRMLIKKETGKETQFIYSPAGAQSSHIPIFDLILRARDETRKIEVKKEVKEDRPIDIRKKLSMNQRKECDEETAKIKENIKKPESKEPHEFKAAKYTHPNGHPRCFICGNEEPIGKVCNMTKKWYQKHEWDDEEAWKEERKKLKEKKLIKVDEKMSLEDYEYLIHHIEVDEAGNEEIHHCFFYDHLGNLFKQSHLVIDKNKIYLDGKEIKEGVFHIISGLEDTQEVVWSDEEAKENKITPKKMKAGMTLKEKAKEW